MVVLMVEFTCAEILARGVVFQRDLGVILGAGCVEKCERSDEDEKEVEDGEKRAASCSSSHLEQMLFANRKSERRVLSWGSCNKEDFWRRSLGKKR